MGADSKSPAIQPAGREAQVFNDHIFSELRAYAQVPDDFVNTGWSLAQLANGGGKGGTLMARVGHSYIVKELSSGDHATLLRLAGNYGHHVRSGETLLCPIYLHFADVATGRNFFVMRNGIGAGPFLALYDLKGCADDKLLEKDGKPVPAVHKRIWNLHLWCGKGAWSQQRHRYFEGKQEASGVDIPMTSDQRDKFVQCLQRDTDWLASHQLMDYSLLVASKAVPRGSASGGSGPSALAQRPLIRRASDGSEVATHVCIIDFLQTWTAGKRVAMVIKCLENNKATVPPVTYGERFRAHFSRRASEIPFEELPTRSAPVPTAVAPPAGDCEDEGKPEDRLYSRPMPETYGS